MLLSESSSMFVSERSLPLLFSSIKGLVLLLIISLLSGFSGDKIEKITLPTEIARIANATAITLYAIVLIFLD